LVFERHPFFQQRGKRGWNQPGVRLDVTVGLGRDIKAGHDAGIHGDKIQFGDMGMQPANWLVHQPALIGVQ